jgi:hypothetical protein
LPRAVARHEASGALPCGMPPSASSKMIGDPSLSRLDAAEAILETVHASVPALAKQETER